MSKNNPVLSFITRSSAAKKRAGELRSQTPPQALTPEQEKALQVAEKQMQPALFASFKDSTKRFSKLLKLLAK